MGTFLMSFQLDIPWLIVKLPPRPLSEEAWPLPGDGGGRYSWCCWPMLPAESFWHKITLKSWTPFLTLRGKLSAEMFGTPPSEMKECPLKRERVSKGHFIFQPSLFLLSSCVFVFFPLFYYYIYIYIAVIFETLWKMGHSLNLNWFYIARFLVAIKAVWCFEIGDFAGPSLLASPEYAWVGSTGGEGQEMDGWMVFFFEGESSKLLFFFHLWRFLVKVFGEHFWRFLMKLFRFDNLCSIGTWWFFHRNYQSNGR